MTAIAGRRPRRASKTVVILTAVIVALAVAAGGLGYYWQMQQQAANDARTSATTAAETDVPALLSYTFSTFSSDLAKAEADTTSHFRSTYANLMTSQIEATAKANQVVTEATVSASSVITAQPDSVTLLMFLNQQTKTKAKAESVLNDTAVRVVMRKVNGTWLVDNLTPHP